MKTWHRGTTGDVYIGHLSCLWFHMSGSACLGSFSQSFHEPSAHPGCVHCLSAHFVKHVFGAKRLDISSRWPRVFQQWAPVGCSPIGTKEDIFCRRQEWQQLTNKTGGFQCTKRTCWNCPQCISMLHLQLLDELNTSRLFWYGKFEHDSNWNSTEVVALSGQRTTGSNPHPSFAKLRISHDLPSHNLKEKVSFSSTHFILLPHLHRVERSEKVCNYQPKTVFAILEMVPPGLWSAVSIRFQFGHTVMFSQVKDSLITSFR